MAKNKVKLLLSLDYELFFGEKTGSVEHCLLNPTQRLLNVVNRHNAKISLFVDAGYLLKLKQYGSDFPELAQQYLMIRKQLQTLSLQGHDIQLHIHPHWQDSHYSDKGWVINTKRYRLHDFCPDEQHEIVASYKRELESCSQQAVFAFRAGGWCLQPFDYIKQALIDNQIWLDSTLFLDGYSGDPTRWFDFKGMPKKNSWKFANDPLVEQLDGYFTEVPISAVKTSPLFFWKLAFHKKFAGRKLLPFGDGQAMLANKSYYLQRLTTITSGPVMLDGYKASQLERAFKVHLKTAEQSSIFNIMGHPKSLSVYSLKKLEAFLIRHHRLTTITYQNLKYLNKWDKS